MEGSAHEIFEAVRSKEPEMFALLELLVNIDSGSYHKEGIDACGRILASELKSLGFEASILAETECGSHVLARRGGTGDRRLFLSAHLDTVFPEGTAAANPFHVKGGQAYGPGVGDIKGGIVQMLYALKALQDLKRPTPPISVFLTGDEEIGSVRGRPHIEEIARRSSWVLVLEPSSKPGSVAVRRWGLGSFHLTITGRAAHVLKPESDGVNACRELALKLLALESLSDPVAGIKVSVNLVQGGRSRQVTAAEARADIDVRVRDARRMESVEAMVRRVAGTPILPGIRVDLEGKLTRPPLEPNAATELLLDTARKAAAELGMEIEPIEEYGGSDGCFTSALGVATLDGLGPLTHDMCGDEEHIEVASFVPRTALLAAVITRLASEPSA